MSKNKFLGRIVLPVFAAAFGFVSLGNSAIIYNISDTGAGGSGIGVGQATVTGTLTTDGTTGALALGDILSWNLSVQCPVVAFCANSNFSLTGGPGGNSTVTLTGNGLLATATQLQYNFGASGYFEIANGSQGWALGLVPGFPQPFDVIFPQGASGTAGPRFASQTATIGTAAAVPEPSSLTCLAVGLFSLGLSAMRKLLSARS